VGNETTLSPLMKYLTHVTTCIIICYAMNMYVYAMLLTARVAQFLPIHCTVILNMVLAEGIIYIGWQVVFAPSEPTAG
jgi:hypothetical protein